MQGETHPRTLTGTTRSNLAAAYLHAHRAEQAIALLERTLADQTRMLGNAHPDTLLCCGNLTAAYAEAGRVDDARFMDRVWCAQAASLRSRT